MRIGLQLDPRGQRDLASTLAAFAAAERDGFASVWLGQVFEQDALTLLALAGTCTERIELGTSVVPLPTRHPTALAQQALTVQVATRGRLCLGVGSGHPALLERKLGLPADDVVGRTREALAVLRPLLRGEHVVHEGRYQRLRVATPIAAPKPPPVLLAALGPRMIALAAELADGVSLVYAGAAFVARAVRPRLPARARIVASLPVVVCDDAARARAAVDAYTGPSSRLPVYARVLAAQGAAHPSEVALVGDEARVEDGLEALAASGVTDLNPILVHVDGEPGAARRSREWLAERARRRARVRDLR
ncbi:MAG: LLM class flavin-dependent oxidoreductase [Myxococcales bacterium]|nr:LLM class flavin-dependent oxidoreductase [Myxococcales bacterium]